MTVEEMTLQAYPKAVDCVKGHIGLVKLSFWLEQDDDRYYIMVIGRCDHCGIPTGPDDYANDENEKRYYAGEEPVAQ